MKKCKWRDGKFQPSFDCNMNIYNCKDSIGRYIEADYCPFCGADIRKPKSMLPRITKSGNTWVAYYNEIDYFCVEPKKYGCISGMVYLTELIEKGVFKPFSEIELNDNIALFRPMIYNRNCCIKQLIHVGKEWVYLYQESDDHYEAEWKHQIKLATTQQIIGEIK